MSNIERINKMVDTFIEEHNDVDLRTDYDLPNMVRIRMSNKNGNRIIKRVISYETLLHTAGYFVVSNTLEEMYKRLVAEPYKEGGAV